ncbi:MAG: hypothetical protein O3A39_10600 [Proteobacteria bacterium]|nr:hypothetical protein [Pseudomonadota bacterium]
MKPGEKFYLIEDTNIYAEIVSEKIMNNIPHYNLIVHRGLSKSQTMLSKMAIEQFYQSEPIKRKGFISKFFS